MPPAKWRVDQVPVRLFPHWHDSRVELKRTVPRLFYYVQQILWFAYRNALAQAHKSLCRVTTHPTHLGSLLLYTFCCKPLTFSVFVMERITRYIHSYIIIPTLFEGSRSNPYFPSATRLPFQRIGAPRHPEFFIRKLERGFGKKKTPHWDRDWWRCNWVK